MSQEQLTVPIQIPDPGVWLDRHGDYLFRYAMFRLRDASLAEDLVQDTLLAALQAYSSFAGRGSERTWLVGILKHKIADHFRRVSRESPVNISDEQTFEHDEFFRTEGWADHWKVEYAPREWASNPAQLLEQAEFWNVINQCLSPLPRRIANAFTLREVDGLSSEEICGLLGISVNNLWVMLHRARLHLRNCIEINWFKRVPGKH